MRERLIGALLLGNNIANIGASALATGIFTAWFGEVGVLYATGVMTVLVVIFAEVLPKTIAINAPDRVSLLVARPMRADGATCSDRCSLVIEAIVRAADAHARHQDRRSTSRSCRRPRGCAARSTCCITKASVEKHDRDMFGGLLDLRELAGLRRHGPSHRDGDDQRRPAAGRTGARGAGDRIHPHSAVARQAGEHHRRAARQGSAARDPRRRRRHVADRRRRPSRCRPGSCRRCGRSPSSSRRSAAARPTSRWWSTSMARSKAW